MNGIILSKSFSPIYNPVTSNNADIIPFRSPNLHLKSQTISPLLANTRVLKHRVYSSSSSKHLTGSNPIGSIGTDVVIPYSLISLGIIGVGLLKALEQVVEPSISPRIKGNLMSNPLFLAFVSGIVASGIFVKIVDWLTVPNFRIGEIIQVGTLEGRVIKKLLTKTIIRGPENREIILPNSIFEFETTVYKTPEGWYDNMSFKIGFEVDDVDKIDEISKEIVKMMKSNPYVLLEVRQPTCYLGSDGNGNTEFFLQCQLKHKDPDVYFMAKQDIVLQAIHIIAKYGGETVACNLWSLFYVTVNLSLS